MIPRIHKRGTNLSGLLRYLFGPGRQEEHVNPRIIASWAGSGGPPSLEPPLDPAGRRSFTRLVNAMEAPLLALDRPPAAPVWHCSLRLAPGDPTLDDDTWARIASQFMHATGLALDGDYAAIPWVAVRHGDDHIHIAAILARQDGRAEPARNDYLKARTAAQDLEREYGLTPTAGADRTGTRRPTAAEQRKAARHGTPGTSREQLTAIVRAVAATAVDERDFFARLQHAGVQVRLRHSTRQLGQITGYAVAMPGDRAGQTPVYFGGGKLAADLSLPRLRRRWRSVHDATMPAATRLDAYRLAAAAVHTAAAHLRTTGHRYPDAAGAVALAASDLLTATAWNLEGQAGGPVTSAARLLDRAARNLMGQVPVRRSPQVGSVRQMARLIGTMGRVADDSELGMALRMMWYLAQFAEHLADFRAAQQRMHQAEAARLAARQLQELAAAAPAWARAAMDVTAGTRPTSTAPTPNPAAVPVQPISPTTTRRPHRG